MIEYLKIIILNVCGRLLYQLDTNKKVIWEEGISAEKNSSQDHAVSKV